MAEKQDEFLYRVSDSLRNGLAEVTAKVEDLYRIGELEDYLDIPDSPIEHVKAALAPLTAQVNDLHDYAETVTGRMTLDVQDVDIHAMLDGVLTIADQLVEQRGGITLEDDIPDDLPSVEADPERLSQVLLHYIHNAVKFTKSGTVTLRVVRESANILFEVADTGIGIPEGDQEKVFEPFETILEGRDDPRLGFGIGLKIVEHIIDLHGGETWFESSEGRGSSFFFTIPL